MLFTKNEPLHVINGPAAYKDRLQGMDMVRGIVNRKKFLYFGEHIDRYHIDLRRARRLLDLFEIFGAIVFTFGLLGFFGLYLSTVEYFEDVFTLQFWLGAGSTNRLFFWLAFLSFGYLIYRMVIWNKPREIIEVKEYGQQDDLVPPQEQMGAGEHVIIKNKQKINIAHVFTREALGVLEDAYRVADRYNSDAVRSEHIFYALLSSQKISGVFVRLGVGAQALQGAIAKKFIQSNLKKAPKLSEDFEQIVFHAYENAYNARQEYVHVTELLVATVRQSENIQELLYDIEVDGQKLANVVEWLRIREKLRRQYQKFRSAARTRSKYGLDRAMTAVATPFLNSFSQDITLAAKFGGLPASVARDKEMEEIFRVIEGGRQNVLLVGEQGVGKMSIMYGITERMIEDDVPDILQDKRLVQLSTSSLLAGTTVSGAQERLIRIMNEVGKAKNIILFIRNIHDLMSISSGEGEGLDVSETLAEYIQGGRFLTFATTTPEAYNRYIVNSQLGSVFAKVEVNEMDENQTIQVLESKAGSLEYKHNVFLSYDSIEKAATLAGKFLHDERLPESAIEIMTEAAALGRQKHGENSLVSAEDVGEVIGKKTGIPATTISEDESTKLMRLEDEMHKRVIGQSEAVSLVANALRRARAEIRSEKRPIANFLFLGPTGVGKTELAKTIAEVYFGGENKMIRIDMSEFQDKSGVYRLIGQPGQKGTGLLTEAVRQQPFSLILLDEMEKADPNILNLFLQVFDDGRLTDSVGRVIDFTNTIIIATSNAGTNYVQEQITAGVELETIRQSLIRGELKQYYRPEFLNRFDGVVLFRALEREEIKKIAGLMLNRVAKDLEKRGVELRVDDAALEALAEVGFDPEFGARPMRRAIQDKIENALAELILAKKLKRRDTVVLGEGANVSIESSR